MEDMMRQSTTPRKITICFADAIVKVSPEVATLLVRTTQQCATPISEEEKTLLLELATAVMNMDAKLQVMSVTDNVSNDC